MNGGHDLGGMHGFGPVTSEPDEPVFHHEWERRAFALTLACGMLGRWNLDMSRHARERIPPPRYLGASYYEIWLEGLLTLLVEQGLTSEREIETGRSAGPRSPDLRVPGPDAVPGILERGGSARTADTPSRFQAGERVRVLNRHPRGHTRAPRYVRGRIGVIESCNGTFVFPDAHAHGKGPQPRPLYTVRFSATELWGQDGAPGDAVHVDLWEDYLEAVPGPQASSAGADHPARAPDARPSG